MTQSAAAAEQRAGAVSVPTAVLSVGGRVLRFVAEEPSAPLRLGPLLARFAVPDDTPADIEVRCRIDEPVGADAPVVFDAGGVWDLRALPDGGEQVCFHGVRSDGGRSPHAVLSMDRSLRRARFVQVPLPEPEFGIRIGFPLDEYLAARLIARAGGLILHASAVLDGGAALVFMGHSGAGKSTISAIAEAAGAEVLSDDRTVITMDGSTPLAWGTPWHGTLTRGSPRRAPIRALFLLAQAPEDAVAPLGAAAAYKEMLVRLVQPTVDRGELLGALDTLDRVAAATPAAVLRFRPAPPAYAVAAGYARRPAPARGPSQGDRGLGYAVPSGGETRAGSLPEAL